MGSVPSARAESAASSDAVLGHRASTSCRSNGGLHDEKEQSGNRPKVKGRLRGRQHPLGSQVPEAEAREMGPPCRLRPGQRGRAALPNPQAAR